MSDYALECLTRYACTTSTVCFCFNRYQSCWLRARCCRVLATSRSPSHEEARAIGVDFFTDVDDFCEEHPEVVILASSILSTEKVLKSLPVQRLKRSTLFVDVLSVKVSTCCSARVWCCASARHGYTLPPPPGLLQSSV